MRKLLTSLAFCGAICVGLGQSPSAQELLDKVHLFYGKTDNYELELTYSMFRGLEGNNITEQYQGIVARQQGKRYFKLLDVEIYTFENVVVTMDHGQKILVYEEGVEKGPDQLQLPSKLLLQQFGKHKVHDQGAIWILELVDANKNFTQNLYGKMVYHIDKDDYKVVKQKNYFTSAVPFKDGEDNSNLDFGRMEIDMTYREPTIEFGQLKDFVVRSNEAGLKAGEKWRSYEFHDNTKNNN